MVIYAVDELQIIYVVICTFQKCISNKLKRHLRAFVGSDFTVSFLPMFCLGAEAALDCRCLEMGDVYN